MEDDIRSKNAVNQRKTKVQLAPTDLAYQGKHGTPETFQLDEQDGVAGVSELEDLIEIVNPNGWWNMTSLALGLMAFFMLPLQSVTYQFLGETPAHWCHIAPLTEANWTQQQIRDLAIPLSSNDTRERNCKFYNYNYTKAVELGYEAAMESRGSISIGDGSPISCQARDFNVSHYSLTLVAEWDLVCEKRALYSTTQSASQFGNLLGDLTFPYFMAKYGRRPITLVCLVLCFVCALGAAVSPWYSFYVLLRIAVNFFCMGCYTGCFVYTLEISSHRQRSIVGSIGGMTWSFGFLAVPGIAYLVRPWRWMQVAFSAPMILLLVTYYWFIVESPRWLISQGRYEEAEEILSRIAKLNGRAFPPSKAVVISLKKMATPSESNSGEASFRHIVRNLKEYFILILKQEHRAKILNCYFCWFAVSLVYYGVSLNAGNLSADPYLYVALGSLAEFPCYPISWVLMVYVGRRLSLAICYWMSGVATCVVALLVASMDEGCVDCLGTFGIVRIVVCPVGNPVPAVAGDERIHD
ncbi:steroid transmembrane transporter SLC22A24-like isoform X2 [Macrobrachium nipponense]|uniref:steroid transmembrane transporter SLC22A24-like isoform X2 n=1 Tax=Macrobrachium nipponense TaxID=159736 RepID=UPI0030C87407